MTTARVADLVWYLVAFVLATGAILVNNGPLYYFDTAGYIGQGVSILKTLGFSVPLPEGAGTGGTADATDDGLVTGSRAAVYSVLMAGATVFTGVTALAIAQALALLLALWLVIRPAVRVVGGAVAPTLGIATITGALGTLSFVTVYLMPDVFAPVMLLVIAALTLFGSTMTPLEVVLALGLGALAVVTHPSHLAIAVLMVPVAGLALLLLRPRRGWVSLVLVTLIPVFGIAERVAFATAAQTVREAEVVYQPFLTVRAIADGPGYAWLRDTCPDETVATCALWDELQVSDDPWRLTASHIMFEESRELGSFKFLDAATQKAVADEQMTFFLSVARDRPIGMGLAFLRNTLDQVNKNDVSLLVPTPRILEQVHSMTSYAPPIFEVARALGDRDWIEPLTLFHQVVYGAALLVIVGYLVLVPKKPPLVIRTLVLLLLAGVFVNAFVCGGVSQPSDRYGARVIFLVPVAAALLVMLRRGDRDEDRA